MKTVFFYVSQKGDLKCCVWSGGTDSPAVAALRLEAVPRGRVSSGGEF